MDFDEVLLDQVVDLVFEFIHFLFLGVFVLICCHVHRGFRPFGLVNFLFGSFGFHLAFVIGIVRLLVCILGWCLWFFGRFTRTLRLALIICLLLIGKHLLSPDLSCALEELLTLLRRPLLIHFLCLLICITLNGFFLLRQPALLLEALLFCSDVNGLVV